jgi:NAD(P)H-flavin reductase
VLEAADPDGPPPRPGQFYMLAAAERWGGGADERPFLPAAFSVLRASAGRLEFMLEDVGPGTARLCELGPGDRLWVMGPLGLGFAPPEDGRRALLCGGGVGTAPLAIWQDELLAAGLPAPALLGFRDAAHADGAALLRNPRVATDDGSAGHHGFVTDLLVAELDADPHATVYACGPPPMLETVRRCARRAACRRSSRSRPGWRAASARASGASCRPATAATCGCASTGPVLDAEQLAEVRGTERLAASSSPTRSSTARAPTTRSPPAAPSATRCSSASRSARSSRRRSR